MQIHIFNICAKSHTVLHVGLNPIAVLVLILSYVI